MILIYTDAPGPRLRYTAHFMFHTVLGIEYQITDNPSSKPALCYGTVHGLAGLSIPAAGLLHSKVMPAELPEVKELDGKPIIFESEDAACTDRYPFDIFGAVFFCISRAEEYVVTKRDSHGRFEAQSSVFHPWHGQPYVDQWIRDFGNWLKAKGLVDELPQPTSQWINTLDIDIAYAYRGRERWRMLGASARDVLQFRFSRIAERIKVLSGSASDPYDNYGLWLEATEVAEESVCFVLCGDGKGYDINLNPNHPQMWSLLHKLASLVKVGIHPSYKTLGVRQAVQAEIEQLAKITGNEPVYSRQHFLRMQIWNTFTDLEALGVQKDFSMGFADAIGFRAGTAHPFTFFDFSKNQGIGLQMVPLIAMDSAMRDYIKLKPEEAFARLKALWQSVETSGGCFVTVWHNHSLSDRDGWEGWREVFIAFTDLMRQKR